MQYKQKAGGASKERTKELTPSLVRTNSSTGMVMVPREADGSEGPPKVGFISSLLMDLEIDRRNDAVAIEEANRKKK